MHIINAMFSRGLGGIEQCFVDYCEAIIAHGHKVTAIIHHDAKIRKSLENKGINIVNVKNFGGWDPLAKSYLKKILKQSNPDAVIAHGNRAVSLLKPAAKKQNCPMVGVTHNYSVKKLIGLDAIFAITDDLKKHVIANGQAENTIYRIPNMIKMPGAMPKMRNFHSPVVIGTMGRFVKKKGFDIFLRSLAILQEQGIDFKAIIGGTGEEEQSLKSLANKLAIADKTNFIGWVNNKEQLFDNIDIFCLPSLHEPFGIILLEAFMSGRPVITSASEGPIEIATNNKDCLVTETGSAEAMADAIKQLINDRKLAKILPQEAFKTASKYEIKAVGQMICDAIEDIISHKT